MDFSRILNKPFFISNVNWPTTSVAFSVLQEIKIPADILLNNLAKVPFESSVFYRCKISLILQVAGTSMHQGTIIASALPIGVDPIPGQTPAIVRSQMGSLMCAPHVFLSANEATPAALEIPFYVNGKLDKTDLNVNTFLPYTRSVNYASARLVVLNPLVAPTNGSTALTVSVFAMFTDMEFYVPHVDVEFATSTTTPALTLEREFEGEGLVEDLSAAATRGIDGVFNVARKFTGDLFDIARRGIRSLTGLHNPNIPQTISKEMVTHRQMTNIVDKPMQYEKLDPFAGFDRVARDYIFDTNIDEMDISYLTSKPQYLGTFVVKTADATGTCCWSRPISPFQQYDDYTYVDPQAVTIQTASFNNLLQVLSSMSRYWKGSLKIHIQSVMSNFHFCKLAVARDYSPIVDSLSTQPLYNNIQNLLVENLEFSAGGQVHTIDMPFCSALNELPSTLDSKVSSMLHGIYYIYLSQPLVVNGTVSPSVSFNVYVSAGDDFQLFGYNIDPKLTQVARTITSTPTLGFTAEAEFDNVVNPQEDILIKRTEQCKYDLVDFRPIVSIRDWCRRPYRVLSTRFVTEEITANYGLITLDVAEMLGQRGLSTTQLTPTATGVSTLGILSRLFYGYAGGARFKIVLSGIPNATAWYVPPGYMTYRTLAGDLSMAGTVPFNFTGSLPTSATNKIKDMYTLISEDDTPFFPGERSVIQTVCKERVDYSTPGSDFYNATFATSSAYMSDSSCMVELEIPNMTPYRFIGDFSKYNKVALPGASGTYATSTSNLGHIIISIGKPYISTAPNVFGSVEVDVFAACDDVARFGYQVTVPTLVIPAVPQSTNPATFSAMTASMNPFNTPPNASFDPRTTTNPGPFLTKTT